MVTESKVYPQKLADKLLVGDRNKLFLLNGNNNEGMNLPTVDPLYSSHHAGGAIFIGTIETETNTLKMTSYVNDTFTQHYLHKSNKTFQAIETSKGIMIQSTYDSLGLDWTSFYFLDAEDGSLQVLFTENKQDSKSSFFREIQDNIIIYRHLNDSSISYLWDNKDKKLKEFILEEGMDLNFEKGYYESSYTTQDRIVNKFWKSTSEGLKKVELKNLTYFKDYTYLPEENILYFLDYDIDKGWELFETDFETKRAYQEIIKGKEGWTTAIKAFVHDEEVYFSGGNFKDGYQVWQLSTVENEEEQGEQGIEQVLSIEEDEGFLLYPNPITTGQVMVNLDVPFDYIIFNNRGQALLRGSSSNGKPIDLRKVNVTQGVLSVISEEKVYTKRFVKY